MHSHLAVLPAGIGTVLTKVNGCRGFIGPVPLPALDGLYSIRQGLDTKLILKDDGRKSKSTPKNIRHDLSGVFAPSLAA